MSGQEILVLVMFLSAGIFAGFLSGLLGIGGGVVFVPILMFASSLSLIDSLSSMHVIVATSLFAGMVTSATSFYNHVKNKNVNFRPALYLTSGTFIAALLTPRLMLGIDSEKLKMFIGVVVGIVGLFMLFEDKFNFHSHLKLPDWTLFLSGLFIGTIAVSSGLGGGVFFAPILIYLYSIDVKKSIGSSTMAVVTAMTLSTISFMLLKNSETSCEYQIGFVNLLAGIPLALGGFIGPKYGVKLLHKVSVPLIRKIFSIFLILYSLKIFGI